MNCNEVGTETKKSKQGMELSTSTNWTLELYNSFPKVFFPTLFSEMPFKQYLILMFKNY